MNKTPLESYPKLAKAVGVNKLFFKREDLHSYGSHKGRSIPVMIDHYLKAGQSRFAISSSGNAALAAALYIKELNGKKMGSSDSRAPIDLDVFIGNHAAPRKAARLKSLADEHIRVLVKERPLQALTQAVNEGARSLRQSTDDTALIGYQSLAEELSVAFETSGSLKPGSNRSLESEARISSRSDLKRSSKSGCSIFIGTSSGTTAQALANYFLNEETRHARFRAEIAHVQIHIVQTSSCHPLADAFESYDGPDEASLADAIVDKTAHRKEALIPLIKKTGGRAWVATNDDIKAAQELTRKNTGLEISTNSALSVAGAMKAVELGYEIGDAIFCLICGE
jgi:hypothetical protein